MGFGEPCATGRSTTSPRTTRPRRRAQGRRRIRRVGRHLGLPDDGPRAAGGGSDEQGHRVPLLRRPGAAPRAAGRPIEPGSSADLLLLDPAPTSVLTAGELEYRHPQSPFVGRALRGRIARTLLRGRTVAIDGRAVGEPRGRFVRPQNWFPGLVSRRGRARTALARGSAPAARPAPRSATDRRRHRPHGGAQRRARAARCPVDLGRVPELRGRRYEDGELVLGATSRTPRRAARRSPRQCPHSQPQLAPSARRRYATAARSGATSGRDPPPATRCPRS